MPTKRSAVILSVIAAFGLAFNANANTITDLGTFSTPDQKPADIQALANTASPGGPGVDSDLDVVLFRETDGGGLGAMVIDPGVGTFTLTQTGTGNNDQQFLTFSLMNGWVLAGVAVHAGNGQNDEFFRVNDETSGTMEGPFYGPGGPTGGQAVSNFDILLENEGTAVSDTGSTLGLLTLALIALFGASRLRSVRAA